jgi:hypothetical protein
MPAMAVERCTKRAGLDLDRAGAGYAEGGGTGSARVTPGFAKNKTRLVICVPRKSTHTTTK